MIESKTSVLAKLLATENITVVQDNVATASFNVRTRVLTLPIWCEVSKDTEDHLVGHEVGHALFTPEEGWHNAVCDRGTAFKSYLNVVEDARIEKLIQRKYPGLRSSFTKSYKTLLKENFFGGSLEQINSMGLIDRINTYFKCGAGAGVKFSPEESKWLPLISELESWEETVVLTEKLFDFAKEQLENEKKKGEDSEEDEDEKGGQTSEDIDEDETPKSQSDGVFETDDFEDEDEESEGSNMGGSDEGDEGEESEESSGADSGKENDEGDTFEDADESSDLVDEDSETGGTSGSYEEWEEELESMTDKVLRDSISRELCETGFGQVYNWKLQKINNFQDYVIDHKTCAEHIKSEELLCIKYNRIPEGQLETVKEKVYSAWLKENQKSVNHMVKEFEMYKSATEYRRSLLAKTGVIDTVKMNNYLFSDDIFKKVTTVPEGKNHGFIMYLDLSGSMSSCLYDVVRKTLLLVHFCRQIGVPFRVYGFTDYLSSFSEVEQTEPKQFDLVVNKKLRLVEFFNESMTKAQVKQMGMSMLCQTYYRIDPKELGLSREEIRTLRDCRGKLFNLGGTPLDDAIVVGIPLAREFSKKYRLDVLNTIFLTDGESFPIRGKLRDMGVIEERIDWLARGNDNLCTIHCPYTNQVHRFKNFGRRMMTPTEVLLKIYETATGSSTIGYRIVEGGRSNTLRNISSIEGTWSIPNESEVWKVINNGGHYSAKSIGYSNLFVMRMDKKKEIKETSVGDSKAALKKGFGASSMRVSNSRKMLTDLIKTMS